MPKEMKFPSVLLELYQLFLLATHSGRYDSLQVLGKMKNEEADFLRSGFVG